MFTRKLRQLFGKFYQLLLLRSGHPGHLLLIALLLASVWLIPHQQKIWGQGKEFIIKKIDLTQYGTGASIDQDLQSKQLAVAFGDCNVIIFDQSLSERNKITLRNCKKLFRAKYGHLNQMPLVISSIYTGSSVLSTTQENFDLPLHKAAVTDSLIVKEHLLSSSDDGTVTISKLVSLSPPQVNTFKLYESIGVARNLALATTADPEVDKVAVSYDTGEISIFNLQRHLPRHPIEPTTYKNINSRINTFKFTPDGSKLLIGYFTGELVALDLNDGAHKILLKVDSWLNTIDINSQNLVAIGDDQGFVRIVSLATGKVVEEHQISSTGINALAFTDEQTIVAVDANGMLYQGRLLKEGQFDG